MAIAEGRAAPLFTLESQQGEEVSLKDFKGKNVILYFYPRDNTPGCTMEARGFRDLWKKIQNENTVVLGVSPDRVESHRKFCEKYKLPFTLLSDPEKKALKKYGAWGEKMMYGKKTIGVIRSTVWIGPNLKVKKHWRKVSKAADHPADVLQALQSDS